MAATLQQKAQFRSQRAAARRDIDQAERQAVNHLPSETVTLAVASYCQPRGLHPNNVRANVVQLATAIREYFQGLAAERSNYLPIPLDCESICDLADRQIDFENAW